MDRSEVPSSPLLAIFERRVRDPESRVERARDAAEALTALLAQPDRDASDDATLDAAAEWFAARLRDPSRADTAEAVEHASAYARTALRALGPRAADAVLGQLSPARPVAELVDGVRLLEEMTADSRAEAIAPELVPRLATLLAVRPEAPLLRSLGTLIARLAPYAAAPETIRAQLRSLVEAKLDGDREDRREAAFHVLAALGSSADDLADRLHEELARSPAAGLALGSLSPEVAYPRIADALRSVDPDVAFGGLRAVEAAAARDRDGAARALADACVRLLHDERPRIGDQALLCLLVLGPPLRALTIWTTAVVERQAAWLFSIPFRAGHASPELLEALFGLVTDDEAPTAVRDKLRGLFFALSRSADPPARAVEYWKRLEQSALALGRVAR